MYIQVMTFHLSADATNETLGFCRTATLGLAEFEGFVSVTPVAPVDEGTISSMIVWRDWMALESFRHSELYARMQMSTHFDSIDDRAFGVESGQSTVDRLSELAAA